jgi:hypothetical protein
VLHDWVPPVPQASVVVGAHTPSPAQVDHVDHVPLLHVRVWLPQLPHAWLAGPMHVCPVQASHWQLALHVCVPPVPQVWVVVVAQRPWPPQVDQSDHVPLLHVRVWLPQLPHVWLDGPLHV